MKGGFARDAFRLPVLLPWLLARGVVAVAVAFAWYFVNELGATPPAGREPAGLVGWDAGYYNLIARYGYDAVGSDGLRFFPLLPLLARVVDLLLPGGSRVALLAVSNAAALALSMLTYRFVRDEASDDAAARSTWLLALFPVGFVLVMGYAESLFMCGVVLSISAARRGRWPVAAVAAFLAALARPLGLLLVAPMVIEAVRQRRSGGSFTGSVMAVVAPVAGTGAYMTWSWLVHDEPWAAVRPHLRTDLRGTGLHPFGTLQDALAEGFRSRPDIFLHALWAVAFIALLPVLFKRWPLSIAVFSTLVLALSLTHPTLNSLERYAFSSVGFVLALVSLTESAVVERLVVVASGIGLVFYATLAFMSVYLP